METQLITKTLEKLKHNFSKGIYFYCTSPTIPEKTHYLHNLICLAEGCRELGIPIYSNVTSWQISCENSDCLFLHDPNIRPSDCSVVILDQGWIDVEQNPLPSDLFQSGREYVTVYIDGSDGAATRSWHPAFESFDLVLRTHMLEEFQYPKNFYPWVFGISNRMMAYLDQVPDSVARNQHLLISFRNTKNQHSVRQWMYRSFLDQLNLALAFSELEGNFNPNQSSDASTDVVNTKNDNLYWRQTGRRHNPHYYAALKTSLASACFGGFFVQPFGRNHATKFSILSKRLLSKWGIPSSTIIQWDSWRLWESLLAGCVSFHADFDQYHFALPVKPENWKHYVGVDCRNPKATVERILDEPEILHMIAENGRKWAISHYAPVPTTLRFLELIRQVKSSSIRHNFRNNIMPLASTDNE
ncbi:MAG: glycosyltransferase family 1 protein [Cyanobacteria bacterium P01_A01_bin.37]